MKKIPEWEFNETSISRVFEFDEYCLIVDVTFKTSGSKLRAEIETVFRHTANKMNKYKNKPVYCLFLAPQISINLSNSFKGNYSIAHPELELYDEAKLKKRTKLNAVYPSSELLNKRGITNKVFRSLIEELLIKLNKKFEEKDFNNGRIRLFSRIYILFFISK